MKLVKKITSVFDRVNDLLAVMAGIILVWLMLSVSFEVAKRYFFRLTTPALFEIWEYSLLYIPFLGAAWLLRREGHVSMDILLTRLRPKAQAILNIITSILGTILSLTLTWYGIDATWETFQLGYHIPGILYPPQSLILMIIPIGGCLLFIQFLRRTHGYFVGLRQILNKEQSL